MKKLIILVTLLSSFSSFGQVKAIYQADKMIEILKSEIVQEALGDIAEVEFFNGIKTLKGDTPESLDQYIVSYSKVESDKKIDCEMYVLATNVGNSRVNVSLLKTICEKPTTQNLDILKGKVFNFK